MENMCFNRVEFTGAKANVNNLVVAFKDLASPQGSVLINSIIRKLDKSLDVLEIAFMDISITEKGINFYSLYCQSIDELKIICKEFKVDFTLKYDYNYQKEYGLVIYTHANDNTRQYILSKTDVKKVAYNQTKKSGKPNKKGTCILEGIEYNSNTEAFDVLFDRKAINNDLCISDFIESMVKAKIVANPELFEESLTPMCSLTLKKVKELVDKYNAHEYINYKSKLIDKVLCANNYEEINNFIRTQYVDDVLFFVSIHQDYFKGIEISNDKTNLEKYWDIQYDVVEKMADRLIDKAIDAFFDWEIDFKLYFLLLVDKNGITPTKEMFKDFMDNPETFTREMNIPQLLAA